MAYILAYIITLLAAITSGGGLWMKNLYKDNDFVKKAWHNNDIITLFVVVPILVVSIILSQKGSIRWFLTLLGLLDYVFYNFTFYLFGATFNVFFLFYAVLMSLSACSIVLFLSYSNLKIFL